MDGGDVDAAVYETVCGGETVTLLNATREREYKGNEKGKGKKKRKREKKDKKKKKEDKKSERKSTQKENAESEIYRFVGMQCLKRWGRKPPAELGRSQRRSKSAMEVDRDKNKNKGVDRGKKTEDRVGLSDLFLVDNVEGGKQTASGVYEIMCI